MPTHLERIRAEVVGIVSKDPLGNLQADRCTAQCHSRQVLGKDGAHYGRHFSAAYWHSSLPASRFFFFLPFGGSW